MSLSSVFSLNSLPINALQNLPFSSSTAALGSTLFSLFDKVTISACFSSLQLYCTITMHKLKTFF